MGDDRQVPRSMLYLRAPIRRHPFPFHSVLNGSDPRREVQPSVPKRLRIHRHIAQAQHINPIH